MAASRLFSKRNAEPVDILRYDISRDARYRVLHVFRQRLVDQAYTCHSFTDVLSQVGERILAEYGRYHGDVRMSPFGGNVHPAETHALSCSDELFLDFVQMCLEVWPHFLAERGVGPVNRIFQEERIGYELTPYREIETDEPNSTSPPGGRKIKYELPRFIRKSEEVVHRDVVMPGLEALTRPGLESARTEMLKAHEAYRRGEYADAITDAGAAFESVMKTICEKKNWKYNPDKDTCKNLVDICQANGLFPPFYSPVFLAVGTIRNKISDAHGRGPTPQYSVGKDQADHLLRLVSTNVSFLVSLAEL